MHCILYRKGVKDYQEATMRIQKQGIFFGLLERIAYIHTNTAGSAHTNADEEGGTNQAKGDREHTA